MAATHISTESSSDDLKETGTYPVRRKGSLLNRWKKSGLALRRYLYCLERKRSESSSNEEDKDTDKICIPHAHTDHSGSVSNVSCCAETSRVKEIKNLTCSKNSKCSFLNNHQHTNCFSLQFKNPHSKGDADAGSVNIPTNENGIGYTSSKKDNSREILEDHSFKDKNVCNSKNAKQINCTNVVSEEEVSCDLCQETNICKKDVSIFNDKKSNDISNLKQIADEDRNLNSEASRNIVESLDNIQTQNFTKGISFLKKASDHCDCGCRLENEIVHNSLESTCLSCQKKTFENNSFVNSKSERTDTCTCRNTVGTCTNNQDCSVSVICSEANVAYNFPKQQLKGVNSSVATVSNNQSTDCLPSTSSPNKYSLCKGDNKNHSRLLSRGDNHASLGIPGTVEINNSTSLSSDSVNTDSSSICDMADGSSEAIVEYKTNVAPSPKRLRKRLKMRTKSLTEDDDEKDSLKLDFGGEADLGVLETSLDYSPSGFLTSLSKIRLGSQLSEESTESETLSTGNPVFEDTDTTDSIPGLNYAMPYLSDRLKTRLAQRIGVGDLCSKVDGENGEMDKDQDKEKKCDDSPLTDNDKQLENPIQRQELLGTAAASGEYMTDERSLSDLLFNLDKIDMIDRVFLREDHSQDVCRLGETQVSDRHQVHTQTMEADTGSEGGDADDEFECDCQFCIGTRLNQGQHNSYRDEDENGDLETVHNVNAEDDVSRNMSDDDRINLWMADEENIFTLNIEELSPLDILMNDRRSELELMFENVILQMLAVHPDLLNDQAPPPASRSVIQSLTSSHVTSQMTSQSLSCPICLCIYEETDSMTSLPCQHQFHPLCIQAWLRQSGTCPVCRFVLK